MNLEKIKNKKTTQELIEFGIINLDKPSGPTSFDSSNFIKKKLDLKKTSHLGTLDPKVTGVLPIALNRACKLTGFFLGEEKEYVGIMNIHEDISQKKVEEAINEKFLGRIKQTPPVKSRVKRQEREREIKTFKILEKNKKEFLFQVACQGGTYIRKLVSDLGEHLKTGAHMLELRRVRAGIFEEDNKEYPIVNLYEFEKAVEEYFEGKEEKLREMIIPAEIICKVYPVVKIKKDNLKQILTGKPINKKDLEKEEKNYRKEIVCIFCEERFIGMYRLIREGDLFAKPEFVMN